MRGLGQKGMKTQQKTTSRPVTDGSWVDEGISGAELPDARLKARLGKVLKQLSQNVSGSIPTALENWADIKGAYRLLSNDRVDDQAIASGHFEATRRRVKASANDAKESQRWIDGLEQATACWINRNAAFTSPIGRATSMSCSVRQRPRAPTFLSGPMLTA